MPVLLADAAAMPGSAARWPTVPGGPTRSSGTHPAGQARWLIQLEYPAGGCEGDRPAEGILRPGQGQRRVVVARSQVGQDQLPDVGRSGVLAGLPAAQVHLPAVLEPEGKRLYRVGDMADGHGERPDLAAAWISLTKSKVPVTSGSSFARAIRAAVSAGP